MALGRRLMPHQQLVIDVGLEVQSEAAGDPNPGDWAYEDIGLSLQRRAGKTSIVEPVVTHRARLVERASMWITAQTRDKARKRWMDITESLMGSPLSGDLRRKVSQGFEELVWKDGGSRFLPFAPNEDGLHSETPDLVLIDEQWAFDLEQAKMIKAGYVPAFGTKSGQAWKMSTAGTVRSGWLNQTRAAGRLAVDQGLRLGKAWFEWGLPDRVDGVRVERLSDQALIAACIAHHPAICHEPGCRGPQAGRPCPHGFTVRPAQVYVAWNELEDRAEFVRAYGNRTIEDAPAMWRGIDSGRWERGRSTARIPGDVRVGLGLDVDEDRREASVSAGWRDPETGVMRGELLRCEAGTRWVARFVADVNRVQRPAQVAVLNAGPSRDVADELERLDVKLLRVAEADWAAASNRHHDELGAGTWTHLGETDTSTAASNVVRRRIARSWGWGTDGDPITALSSQTLAGWAVDHAPVEEPPRRLWMR